MGPPLHDSCFGDVKLLGDSWFTCSILVICDYLFCVEDADLCTIALKVTGGELVWMVCSCIPPGLPCAVALGWCFVCLLLFLVLAAMDQLSDAELWVCLPKRLRSGLSAAGSSLRNAG